MKELSIEEKAKAYDKALRKVKDMLSYKEVRREDMEYIFPELKESEDERIRKEMITYLSTVEDKELIPYESWITWLEKQGEHANFRNKIQIGDKVTRNEDGMLVNLSQLKRVAKPAEEQGEQKSTNNQFTPEQASVLDKHIDKFLEQKPTWSEEDEINRKAFPNHYGGQKPADKVEPKFKVGDWIVTNKNHIWYVDETPETTSYLYRLINQYDKVEVAEFEVVDNVARLWTVEDAKNGDVLINWSNTAFIFKAIEDETVKFHIAYNEKWNEIKTPSTKLSHLGLPEPQFEFHPATKEQRDQLEKAMADAGYTFDFEKKELKKIEQKQEWSEQDYMYLNNVLFAIDSMSIWEEVDRQMHKKWLKSLRPRSHWKPSDEQMITLRQVISGCSYDIEPLVEIEEYLKKLKE